MNQFATITAINAPGEDFLATGFLRQNHAIVSIKLLSQLTKSIQQHRGISMGFCSGELAFLPMAEQLQQSIGKLFNALELHNQASFITVAREGMANASNNWKTILVGWRHDKPIHNFEFHGHLIDGLKKMIRDVMREHLHHRLKHDTASYYKLLQTIFVELPDNIESLGKLRGLSTNAAIVKACGDDSHARISFLLGMIPEQNKKLLGSLQILLTNYPNIRSLQTLKQQQKTLHQLLINIQMNILDQSRITENSTHLFGLSTSIVDAHWVAMEQGIHLVDRLLYDDFIDTDVPGGEGGS